MDQLNREEMRTAILGVAKAQIAQVPAGVMPEIC
jgi:hypothetical protein